MIPIQMQNSSSSSSADHVGGVVDEDDRLAGIQSIISRQGTAQDPLVSTTPDGSKYVETARLYSKIGGIPDGRPVLVPYCM